MKKKLLICLALVAAIVLCAAVSLAEEGIVVPEDGMVDEGQINSITKIGNHAVKNAREIKKPTCTETGLAEFDCAEESQTTHQHHVIIKATGHKWASESGDREWGNVKKAPSCTESGYAVDVCLNCGLENPAVIRNIDPKQHEYNDKTYNVYKQPTCVETGLGQHKCIYCGMLKEEKEDEMVVLGVIPHKWTKWNITPSTCDTYGSAVRDCESCDARQVLDKDHLEVKDQGKKVSIDDVIPLVNKNYDATIMDGKTYTNKQDFDKALAGLKFDYEPEKDWLEDCYTRKITYRCPHCKSKTAGHPTFTVTLKQPMVVAHVWNTKAQPQKPDTTGADEKTIRSDTFINDGNSLAPTCLLPGFDLYFCQYDKTNGEKKDLAGVVTHTHDAKDQYKKVYIDATGHDWTDWVYIETFESKDEGKLVKRYARTCKTCNSVENKNVIEDKPAPKNGLAQDEEGKWHYYVNGEIDKTKTGIVEFEGGEFWVVKGDLAEDANGLTICPDGKAYYLAQGQIQRKDGFAEYHGEWFMLKNGELDESANGLYDYDGGTFVFAAGRLRKDVNGLWLNPKDNKWYFLANGQVQKVSQVAEYNGEFFLVKDGVLDTAYKGTIEYDGETFIVVNGQLYEPLKVEEPAA